MRMATLLAALFLPTLAHAQQPAQQAAPPGLTARAVELNARCQAAGGRIVNGDRPFVYFLDLTGDRRAESIMDEGAFVCSNRSITEVTPTGAPLEVFDGASGHSLWRGMAYTYSLQRGQPRSTLTVTLRGPACSQNALATTTCQRPLTWNATARTLTGAPTLPPATSTVAAAQASAPAATAGAMTLSEADKAAAFRAAGFNQTRRGWERCEDPGTLSYSPGAIEEVLDLNNDGRPEVVLTEGGTACFGMTGAGFVIMSREADGSWRNVMDIQGVFRALPSRANGWQEIEVGGPGMRGMPIWRYTGRAYDFHRVGPPPRP